MGRCCRGGRGWAARAAQAGYWCVSPSAVAGRPHTGCTAASRPPREKVEVLISLRVEEPGGSTEGRGRCGSSPPPSPRLPSGHASRLLNSFAIRLMALGAFHRG